MGNARKEEPEKKPWDVYPQITVKDWEKFVAKSTTTTALEKSQQATSNTEKKMYNHHMGCKTFAESRPKWIKEGLYPASKIPSSDKPLDSTVTSLVSRANDWWCAMHGIDKNTGKYIMHSDKRPVADALLEHTSEVVEGKLTPSIENDPFTLALGKPYHPGESLVREGNN
ncbi:uncharacterized protein LOC110721949 [Chenopodium quinoa]|uniref:uncharacterized protein LOC110721949 n=1 Tax=Chenopodium quinoa TaxID=63459 RepID=UPI000B78B26F|nr:uncharacterized protein LOC110721949 [Chenopodium quinoa]